MSLRRERSSVTINPAAEKARSASTDVGGMLSKALKRSFNLVGRFSGSFKQIHFLLDHFLKCTQTGRNHLQGWQLLIQMVLCRHNAQKYAIHKFCAKPI